MDQTELDFQAMISMSNGHGLQAFMSHLAKRAEINYLVVKYKYLVFKAVNTEHIIVALSQNADISSRWKGLSLWQN